MIGTTPLIWSIFGRRQQPRLDRIDVHRSLEATMHVLEFITRRGHNRVPLTSTNVRMQGKRVPFRELPKEVENSL